MPFTLTMPKLSPTMEGGTIVKWHKKVGDFVEANDLLLEVATDKATVEYYALDSGWLRKILIGDGKEAIVNQAIAILSEGENENIDSYQPEGIKPAAAKPAAIEPSREAKAAGEEAAEKAPAAAVPTAAIRQPSFTPEAPLPEIVEWRSEEGQSRLKASPLAKKLAKEKGLDLTTVKGSGPGGRIISEDLAKAQPSGLFVFGKKESPKEAPGAFIEEPLTPMRKVISQRLQDAKSYIPHFYVSMKIDAEPLMAAREQLKANGIKVTVNDFIVKASALALRKHPNVNSGFNSATNSIVRFKTIDISVAVSLPAGLITPIVRYADYKNLGEISMEVKELAGRAKEGKLEAHEYKGGSFTISNLGMYGVSEFIAILNPPQAAILAVSGIADVPVVKNGTIVPGHEMTLTLSGDHRVIDGVAGAEFLKTLKQLLESPAVLLI